MIWCSCKRRRYQKSLSPSLHTHKGKAMWRSSENVAVYKPGKEVSPETSPDGTWSWTSSLKNCEEIRFCCLRHRSVVFAICYGNLSRPMQALRLKEPWQPQHKWWETVPGNSVEKLSGSRTPLPWWGVWIVCQRWWIFLEDMLQEMKGYDARF